MIKQSINVPDREMLRSAWEEFVATGRVSNGVIRDEILESWGRCRSCGLDPNSERIVTDLSEEDKERIQSDNRYLVDIARPFLEGLYDLVKSLEMVVFLTGKDGFILGAIGEGAIWEYCLSKNAMVGSSFNEKYIGTTSVSMALALDRPYQMMAEEHYNKMVHLATCAAAPIHDESGAIMGCLDLTARYEIALKHPHTLGMIVAAAQFIESQLKLKKESERSQLTSEYLKAALEAMSSALIIVNEDNIITHVNPVAERIFGVSFSTISNKRLENLIKNDVIIEVIKKKKELQDHELILHESLIKPRCLVSLKPILNPHGEQIGSVLSLKELKKVQRLVQRVIGAQAQYTFQDIKGESREIKDVIKLCKTVAGSPSNVLITGESGTGKEMVAQSIHNGSDYSGGPFLALNCAAIPHDLVESELFGYEAGTFTGGIREGKSGKFELVAGGTLFMDEINGMPLAAQAKLLRALEDKKFFRLGGTRYLHLDARIITATNKDILQEIEMGNFRSDLYYRLNVLEINIPPLRERGHDIRLLAHLFLQEISEKVGKRVEDISPEAIGYLERRSWPGNVRELKNWIERAVNLVEGSILTLSDFPQDERSTGKDDSHIVNERVQHDTSDLHKLERITIMDVLEECGGNITEASRRLGIGRATLYRKMKKYQLSLFKSVL